MGRFDVLSRHAPEQGVKLPESVCNGRHRHLMAQHRMTMASKGTVKPQTVRFGFESTLRDFTSALSGKVAVNSASGVIVRIPFSLATSTRQ